MSGACNEVRVSALRARIAEADAKLKQLGVMTNGEHDCNKITPSNLDPKIRAPDTLEENLNSTLMQHDELLEHQRRAEMDTVPEFRSLARKMEKALSKVDMKMKNQICTTEKSIQTALKSINKASSQGKGLFICGYSSSVQRLAGISAEAAMASRFARGVRISGGYSSSRYRAEGGLFQPMSSSRGGGGGGGGRGEATTSSTTAADRRKKELLERGTKAILETFPYITKEQAIAALEMHRYDATRTMSWMISQDEIVLLTTLSDMVESNKKKQKKGDNTDGKTTETTSSITGTTCYLFK